MRVSADFKDWALDALSGRWKTAVLAGIVASLLGAAAGGGSSTGSSSSNGSYNFNFLPDDIKTLFTVLLIGIIIYGIFVIVIGGAARLGYSIFNLKLIDGKEVSVSDVTSQLHRIGDGFCMNFFIGLYTFLWSLLFVIPGIIKTLSYSMAPYILAEHPEYTAHDAINESKEIMDGNKWRLFCLQFSFIGWNLLCALPVIILMLFIPSALRAGAGQTILLLILTIPLSAGYYFLAPYQNAAMAAFYRDVSGTEVKTEPEKPESGNWYYN